MLRELRSLFGRKEHIASQTASSVQEFREHPTQQAAADVHRRVGINLNEPRFPSAVDQEVQPEQLKADPFSIADQLVIAHGVADVPCHPFHLGYHFLVKVAGSVVLQVFVDLAVGQLVGCFVLAVIFHILLDGFVGQMDAL